MSKMVKKSAMAIVLLAIIVLLVYGYFSGQKASKPSTPKPKKQLVTVQILKKVTIPQTVTGYGQTVSPVSVALKAQADGMLTSQHFKPGEVIHKGQLLFTLKTSDSTAQLKKLQAQMQLSQQIYLRTKRQAELAHGGVSIVDLLKAKMQYQQDLATYQQARAIYRITSPINGTITDTDLAVGDYVNAGTVLANIIDMHSLQLRYRLPSRYIHVVKQDQLVTFIPENSKHGYQAKVSYISPMISTDNADFILRANFVKTNKLAAHQFGQIQQLLNAKYQTLAVPQELVQSDAQGFYVYLLKMHKVSKQYFTAGEVTKAGLIEVKNGLKVGQTLITTNPHLLQVGQRVQVTK